MWFFFREIEKKTKPKTKWKIDVTSSAGFFDMRERSSHFLYGVLTFPALYATVTGVRNMYATVKENNWHLKWFLNFLKFWKFQGNLCLIEIADRFLNIWMIWVFKNSLKGMFILLNFKDNKNARINWGWNSKH